MAEAAHEPRVLAVEAEGFSFSYPVADAPEGGAPAPAASGIGPLDWQVAEGSFHLLVGATGSGKTTLLRCLKQAIAPVGSRSGQLRAFGREACGPDAGDAASLVGYVAQSPDNQVVCDTVWHELAFGLENLGTPQDQMRRRVAEVAHFFGIEPWFRRAVADLSGGQRQMVTLAGVLAMQPRLLLLDEPTAQLDPVAAKSFLHALFRVNRELGITVVAATHAPEAMAEYATDASELAGGAVRPVDLARFAPKPLNVGQQPQAMSPHARAWGEGAPNCHPERRRGAPESKDPPQDNRGLAARADREALGRPTGDPSTAPPTAAPLRMTIRVAWRRSAQDDGLGALRRPRSVGQQPQATSFQPAIVARDAWVRYRRDDAWVLRGLDLQVACGSVHALVGGNGCGKSTLLRAVAGVLRPVRGSMRNALAARQALLPQDPKALFVCDTVEEELREWQKSCGYDDARLLAAAEAFGLQGRMAAHPYDLSGGQQQLLALAKLLLTSPDLLLADEPTKGLDPASKLAVAHAVRRLADRGATVLMATHDLAFAALVADRATMLFDGEDACTQPAGDFFANNLFYRPSEDGFTRLWQEQGRERGQGRAPEGEARL